MQPKNRKTQSQVFNELENLSACRVRLLLVDFGRDDAHILDAPVVEDAAIAPFPLPWQYSQAMHPAIFLCATSTSVTL